MSDPCGMVSAAMTVTGSLPAPLWRGLPASTGFPELLSASLRAAAVDLFDGGGSWMVTARGEEDA